MQNLDVLRLEGLFVLSNPLRVLKQGIGSFVSLVLIIIDLEMVTRKFLSLADLSGAQNFRVHELSKVDMVGKHEDFMSRAF